MTSAITLSASFAPLASACTAPRGGAPAAPTTAPVSCKPVSGQADEACGLGVWTKADSVTYFDDMSAELLS